MVNGLIEPPLGAADRPEIVVGLDVVGIETEGFLESTGSALDVP